MFLEIDATAKEPIYQQIRDRIVAGIALGELTAGMQLPSVRALASDLGINLHTVNKAYAVLRDEGYVRMKGRSGAFIAEPGDGGDGGPGGNRATKAASDLEKSLFEAALTYRANGGTRGQFLEAAAAQAARAYGVVGEGGGAQPEGAPLRGCERSARPGTGRPAVARARSTIPLPS